MDLPNKIISLFIYADINQLGAESHRLTFLGIHSGLGFKPSMHSSCSPVRAAARTASHGQSIYHPDLMQMELAYVP